jgi:glycosyltransferase involved in cell wall biosynthesis
MRILLVMPLAEQRGGAELMLKQFARHPSPIKRHIVFLEDGPLVAECRTPTTSTSVVDARRLRNIVQYTRTVRAIAQRARSFQADAILGWMSKGHLYGGMAALLAGRPAFWFQLGLPADIHWMDRLAALIPSVTILTCSQAGAQMQEALWPHRETAVVHPGTDLDQFSPDRLPDRQTVRAALDLPAKAPVITLVGRLQRWKGIHVFIESMVHVIERYPDARGVIVGGEHALEPDYRSYLERLIRRLNLDHVVRMVGFQSNVPEWMHAADVVVHASDREPFGIVVIEAMALGKPVVATDTGGPPEIITSGKTGRLTPFGNAEALSDGILKYLDDPETARDIGAAGQRRAHEFTVQHYFDSIRNVLQQQTDSYPPSPERASASPHSTEKPFLSGPARP